MIALWMVYATVVGCLLAATACALEHLAAAHAWPRRWVWLGAMLALPLVPLFTSELPPLLSTAEQSATTPGAIPVPSPAKFTVSMAPTRIPAGSVPHSASFFEQSFATAIGAWAAFDVASFWANAVSRAQAQLTQLARFDRWFVSGWLVTTLLLLAGYVMATVKLTARRRRWLTARIDGTPVLIASDVGPAVVGAIQPAIVLPLWSLSIDAPLRALILAHEREHLRARDPLALHLMALSAYLLPWNLPVWWMLRRLRLAIEVDCDQRVLRAGGDAHQYADLLLTVGSRRSPGARLLAPALVEGRSFLARRILAMCRGRSKFRYLRLVFSGSVAYLLLAVAYTIPRPALAQKAHRAGSGQQRMWRITNAGTSGVEADVPAEKTMFVVEPPSPARRALSQRNAPEKSQRPSTELDLELNVTSNFRVQGDSLVLESASTAPGHIRVGSIRTVPMASHDSSLGKFMTLHMRQSSSLATPVMFVPDSVTAPTPDSSAEVQVRWAVLNFLPGKNGDQRSDFVTIEDNDKASRTTSIATVEGVGDDNIVTQLSIPSLRVAPRLITVQSFSTVSVSALKIDTAAVRPGPGPGPGPKDQ